jgi:hypothetical protein
VFRRTPNPEDELEFKLHRARATLPIQRAKQRQNFERASWWAARKEHPSSTGLHPRRDHSLSRLNQKEIGLDRKRGGINFRHDVSLIEAELQAPEATALTSKC